MKIKFSLVGLLLLLLGQQAFVQNTLWKFQSKGRIYASPAVTDNMVFIGSGDSTFYALNKQTGAEVWRFKTMGAIHSDPLVFNNSVVFASTDGALYALDKTTGTPRWKFNSQGEQMLDMWDYYLSSPVRHNEKIFWGCGDGFLYALDGEKGTCLWKFEAKGIIHATPLVQENAVYFGDYAGFFYALNANNGSLQWQFRTVGDTYFPNGEIQKEAAWDRGILYFGSRDYNCYALDAKTGRGHWNSKERGSWIIATPLIYNDHVFFGTSDTHRFYCVKKSNGEITWQISLPMRVYGAAVAYKDLIFFGCFDGILRAVDPQTAEIKWQFQTDGSKENYHLVYNQEAEFLEGFELYGKDYLESERMIHSLGSILATPVIDKDVLYISSSDGVLYAIDFS